MSKRPSKNFSDAYALSPRERDVMRFTVQEFIDSAKPVGSEMLCRKYFRDLSSASIRSVLAQLEERGLLRQPHLSAGRVPTEKGYRFFIDALMEPRALSSEERQALSKTGTNAAESLRDASKYLSSVSQQVGIATSPRLDNTIFKQVEFVRVGNDKILVIFIAKNNIIDQRLVQWQSPPSQDELWKMAKYLNEMFSDATLSEIRRGIKMTLETRPNPVQRQALQLQHVVLNEVLSPDQAHDPQIFVEGQSHLFQKPEFAGGESMGDVFKAFEEKQTLLQILDLAMSAPTESARIVLGSELGHKELAGMAFVTRTYGAPDHPLGTVAIAGPTRMDYGKIVPVVDFAAQTLNKWFTKE